MDSKTDAVLDAVSLGPNGKASLRHPKKKNLEQVVGRPDGFFGAGPAGGFSSGTLFLVFA